MTKKRARVLYAFSCLFFFFQAEDGIRDYKVTGVQTCALPIYFGIAAADGDGGQVAVAIDEEAVFAGTQQCDGGVGSIDLKRLAIAESAQADMEGAAGKRELHHAVVEIEDGEGSFGTHAQGGGAHVELGAGTAVGQQVVAVVEGVIDGGGGPLIDRARAEGDGSAHVVQTGHAGRRVVLYRSEERRV